MVLGSMCAFAVSVQVASAENGAKATFFNAGEWSGYNWMSSAQPTVAQSTADDECGAVPPACWSSGGFACGPGSGSAGGPAQVGRDGSKLALVCTAQNGDGNTGPTSLNAQLYMSNSNVSEGESFSQDLIDKQRTFAYGDFVWYIDTFELDGQPVASFPGNLVVGLYLYSPNMKYNGAVDCTHELDVEYASWGSPLAFTSWPEEISTGQVDMPIRESAAFQKEPHNSCVGMRWEEGAVTYFQWQDSSFSGCTQGQIDACLSGATACVKHAVPYSNQKGSCTAGGTSCIDTPITDPMTPSMNLWTTGSGSWHEAKLTLGGFNYFPVTIPAVTVV